MLDFIFITFSLVDFRSYVSLSLLLQSQFGWCAADLVDANRLVCVCVFECVCNARTRIEWEMPHNERNNSNWHSTLH